MIKIIYSPIIILLYSLLTMIGDIGGFFHVYAITLFCKWPCLTGWMSLVWRLPTATCQNRVERPTPTTNIEVVDYCF